MIFRMLRSVGIALAAGAFLLAPAQAAQQSSAPVEEPVFFQGPPGEERPGDRVLGPEDAPILFVEYASIVCPHCANFHEHVYSVLKSEYIETGRMRFIMREVVTDPPQLAYVGFMLADCAPNERYYDAIDLLFTEQGAIFEAAGSPQGARAIYDRIAGAVGLSPEGLTACLEDRSAFERVGQAHAQAFEDEIRGTPRLFINGRALHEGENPAGGPPVFYWGDDVLLIEGETLPAVAMGRSYIAEDAAVFRRIVEHFLAEADQ